VHFEKAKKKRAAHAPLGQVGEYRLEVTQALITKFTGKLLPQLV
jgi:hypothetical protein